MKARVAIVGGGLAGLAAAVALADSGCELSLLEARRRLGGRAASFVDPISGERIDHCQHVSMGCCTNLDDFCARTGLSDKFRSDRVLRFFGTDGRECRFEPTPWLPAPLHVAPAVWRMKFLSPRERLAIGRAVWRLARWNDRETADSPTMHQWLVKERQSAAAIEQFWAVILVSALGDCLDRVAVSAARKVIVDGFFSSQAASVIRIPTAPLSDLYGPSLERWLVERGVQLRLGLAARSLARSGDGWSIRSGNGSPAHYDFVVLAVAWRQIGELLDDEVRGKLPWVDAAARIASAPIAGVHLWFDQPIMQLPHAVLVGRMSQWVFRPGASPDWPQADGHYYQVVISGAHQLAGRAREEIVCQAVADLASIWPVAAQARLLRSRVVNDPHAVYSIRPGLAAERPDQETGLPGLLVAGDWTRTHWPATMEGAVRSGYLAAEQVLRQLGRPQQWVQSDLQRGRLVRWLLRGAPPPNA